MRRPAADDCASRRRGHSATVEVGMTDTGDNRFTFDVKRRALVEALRAEAGISISAERIGRRPGGDPPPLSFAQQRLWFLDRLEPASPLYNVALGTRFSGRLDLSVLERSLKEIVRRHEVLRTTFE